VVQDTPDVPAPAAATESPPIRAALLDRDAMVPVMSGGEGALIRDSPPGDQALVRAARAGHIDAFGALVAPHAEVLFRLACHVTGDAAEADDAVQEGLIRAHGALSRFREDAPLRPWLLRIVYNEARSRVRARGRRQRLLERLHLRPDRHAPDPMLEVLAAETRDEVATVLAGLRPEDREVITLRYFLGLDEAEMAATLGCARGTVKSRLSRALGRMREALGPEAAWTR
jgi:RNA polymerase sigma-70 factor (ECF subfamily)